MTAVAASVVLAALVGCGGGDGDAGAGGDGERGGSQRQAGGVTYDCPSVDVEIEGDAPIQAVEAGICSYSYGSGSHHASYGLVVENTGTEPLLDVDLRVEADTADGRIALHPLPDMIDVLPGGGRMGVGHGVPLEEPADIETLVVHVEVPDAGGDAGDLPRGEVVVREPSTTLDDEVERTNRFTVSSTTSDILEDVPVFVVYRNDAGDIVGGALDTIGRLVPVPPAEHSFTDTYGNPDATSIEVYVDARLLPTGAGADAATLQLCDDLAAAGADPMQIRLTLREGGAAAEELLSRLAGITPPGEIADAWGVMMAEGGRPIESPTDPLYQAANDVSRFILDHCGIPGLG